MEKNNQKEKKENPFLMGIITLLGGIVFFSIRKSYDFEIFLLFTIPGEIAFPVLGVFSFLISFFQFKEWFTLRKKRKEQDKE
jgi:hypothetical protein